MRPRLSARPIAIALILGLVLGIAGCETTPVADGPAIDAAEVERLAKAGDWNSIANASFQCAERTEACAKAYATKGDACLRLAIQQPLSDKGQNALVTRLLDCAENSYRTALLRQPSVTSKGRPSYHGGLLLTLSERRNRLSDGDKARLAQENDKLLRAADVARREAPNSAFGFLYGASAQVYRAVLQPGGRGRCGDLAAAYDLLKRSPRTPTQLTDEAVRIRALTRLQLRSNGCGTVDED